MLAKKLLSPVAIGFLAAALLLPVSVHAELYMEDTFSYDLGNLYQQGDWVRKGKNSNEPIQVISGGLTYPGYQTVAKGNSVKLIGTTETSAHESLQKQFSSTGVTSGAVYMSALLNFSSVPMGGNSYFLNLSARGAKSDAGIVDEKNGTDYARVFAVESSESGRLKLGVSKNGTSVQATFDTELELNTTYLVVLKYEFVDGTNNDNLYMWLNPAGGSEPGPGDGIVADNSKADVPSSMGLQGVNFRQGSTGTKTAPGVTVDVIRIADSWADLWESGGGGGGETPEPGTDAEIMAGERSISFGPLYQYMKQSALINIKARNLTEDIKVSLTGSDVKASATTIPMADAMNNAGYMLTLDYTAGASNLSETLTLSSAGAADVVIPLTSISYPATAFANLRQISQFADGDICYFQGKATVTFVDKTNGKIYAQDIYGGGCVFEPMFVNEATVLSKGDRITKFFCQIGEPVQGIPTVYLSDFGGLEISPGYTVEPVELTLPELVRDPETYLNCLVKISDVEFPDSEGQSFSTVGVPIVSGGAAARLRPFGGTDIIGTPVPAKAQAVTGISTSATATIVSIRKLADIESGVLVGEPSIAVTEELLVDAAEYLPINKPVTYARFIVKADNIPQPATVYHAGADRDMFSIDVDEIPAGSSETVITVTYNPTAKGVHRGSLVIDAVPATLSKTYAFTARAYDPDNLPVITVNPGNLKTFTATVGTNMTQTVTYSTEGLLDYGSIKLVGGDGQFRINSGSMLKDSKNVALAITFSPQKAGTYSAQVEFSADKADTKVLTIAGVASGETPVEDKQGDEFTMASFDTSNARYLVIEDFQDCGDNNTPLHIDGWTNAAVEGTRAWWAYTDINDASQKMAKVTGYDSKAGESSSAQMLLLSPCLDFVNARQPLLTFRIMGKNMLESQPDNLQVIYIDPYTEDYHTLDIKPLGSPLDMVYAEPIGGLDIPASADYNEEWRDYVVDFKGLDIADKFFIAFGYASMRGRDTSTMYFVDDFSWGRDDVKFIRVGKSVVEMKATEKVEAVSEYIDVEGLNISSDISLTVEGANSSKFSVYPATLPASGGKFKIHFLSEQIGVHAAYIKLSAAGAPDSYISLEVNNVDSTGIDSVDADGNNGIVNVYNMQGMLIKENVSVRDVEKLLPPGLYIMGGKKVYVK